MIDHWPVDHRVCIDQMHQDDQQSSVAECSQPHMVECTEAVDSSNSTKLVGVQSTPLTSHLLEEWIAYHIKSLLSTLISSGGKIASVLPTQVIIDIHGQKIILITDPVLYEEGLHNGKCVGLPDCVARHRGHLTCLDVHPTTVMIDNAPTVIGLLLLPASINSDILVCCS